MLKHYPTCSPHYPEKPDGEPAALVVIIDIGNGERVRQCMDCGAFELLPSEGAPENNGSRED